MRHVFVPRDPHRVTLVDRVERVPSLLKDTRKLRLELYKNHVSFKPNATLRVTNSKSRGLCLKPRELKPAVPREPNLGSREPYPVPREPNTN